ncbi:MAG: divergent PAP2 family protein [bacterium]
MPYQFFVLPIVAGLIAQIIKFLIKSNKTKFSWKNIFSYSGMPSGHSAMTVGLATIIGLELGISSPLFAFTVIFALLTLRDAMGLRKYIGKHGEIINDLVEDLDEDKMLDQKYPKLLEKIGHSFLQVLIGSLIGFAVSYLGFIYWN